MVVTESDYNKYNPANKDVKDFYDQKTLAVSKIKDVSKINLSEKTAQKISATQDISLIKDNMVQTSTDYSLFNAHSFNRPISNSHVGELVKSIGLKDLTHLCPILVSEDFVIIDGHHRFAALQKMRKPIHYKIIVGTSAKDLLFLNSAQKAWTGQDFVHFYAQLGYPDYSLLLKDCLDFGYSSSMALKIAFNRTHKNLNKRLLANGALKYTTENSASVAAFYIEHRIFKALPFYNDNRFISSFISIRNRDKYIFDIMKLRLEQYGSMLTKQVNVGGFTQALADLYNYHTRAGGRI